MGGAADASLFSASTAWRRDESRPPRAGARARADRRDSIERRDRLGDRCVRVRRIKACSARQYVASSPSELLGYRAANCASTLSAAAKLPSLTPPARQDNVAGHSRRGAGSMKDGAWTLDAGRRGRRQPSRARALGIDGTRSRAYRSRARAWTAARRRGVDWQRNRERRPDTGFALARNRASVGLDDLLCNRKSQA